MTGRQLLRHDFLKRLLWFCVRWGITLGIFVLCFKYVYPRYLINASPDIRSLLEKYPTALRQLTRWAEQTVLPFLYGSSLSEIHKGAEYVWLMFLIVCMGVGVVGSYSIMAGWRILSRVGLRAAERSKRAFWLFVVATLLILALNVYLCLLVCAFWREGRQTDPMTLRESLEDCVMCMIVFIVVPIVAPLTARFGAPMRVGGEKGVFPVGFSQHMEVVDFGSDDGETIGVHLLCDWHRRKRQQGDGKHDLRRRAGSVYLSRRR